MSKIAITSIQKNRNKYIIEWIAFHLTVGFNQFYIYCHKTDDGMVETLTKIKEKYPVEVFVMDMDDFPQLIAYQHSWKNYGNSVEWMAFIDGDEFLFPTNSKNIQDALIPFKEKRISAIGAFWRSYGTSGHVFDPDGLLIENYLLHAPDDYLKDRLVKSIVKGGESVALTRSHVFETENGTFDENMRPIDQGWMKDLSPTYNHFRINHYVFQSREFSFETKVKMDMPDLIGGLNREKYYAEFDELDHTLNTVHEDFSVEFKNQVRQKSIEIADYLGLPPPHYQNRQKLYLI